MIDGDPNLDLMPGWRRAFREFIAAGFKVGDVVSRAWFDEHLGTEPPQTGTLAEFDSLRLRWLRQFSRFHHKLRDEHQIALWPDVGGYRLLTASEQLRIATEEGRKKVRNALRWQAEMLLTTDTQALSDVERANHADALARLTRFKSMMKQLPSPTLPEKAP